MCGALWHLSLITLLPFLLTNFFANYFHSPFSGNIDVETFSKMTFFFSIWIALLLKMRIYTWRLNKAQSKTSLLLEKKTSKDVILIVQCSLDLPYGVHSFKPNFRSTGTGTLSSWPRETSNLLPVLQVPLRKELQ